MAFAPYPGQLSARIVSRMRRLKLSTRALAKNTNVCYEYIRQTIRGVVYPIGPSLERLADGLGVDRAELRQLALNDRLSRKVGLSVIGPRTRNTPLMTIQHCWASLTQRQQEDLVEFGRYLARRNQGPSEMPR